MCTGSRKQSAERGRWRGGVNRQGAKEGGKICARRSRRGGPAAWTPTGSEILTPSTSITSRANAREWVPRRSGDRGCRVRPHPALRAGRRVHGHLGRASDWRSAPGRRSGRHPPAPSSPREAAPHMPPKGAALYRSARRATGFGRRRGRQDAPPTPPPEPAAVGARAASRARAGGGREAGLGRHSVRPPGSGRAPGQANPSGKSRAPSLTEQESRARPSRAGPRVSRRNAVFLPTPPPGALGSTPEDHLGSCSVPLASVPFLSGGPWRLGILAVPSLFRTRARARGPGRRRGREDAHATAPPEPAAVGARAARRRRPAGRPWRAPGPAARGRTRPVPGDKS